MDDLELLNRFKSVKV